MRHCCSRQQTARETAPCTACLLEAWKGLCSSSEIPLSPYACTARLDHNERSQHIPAGFQAKPSEAAELKHRAVILGPESSEVGLSCVAVQQFHALCVNSGEPGPTDSAAPLDN
eukprot:6189192-Pleurochrysis_carterae.AAC.3